MNFLAHAFLSGENESIILGNFLGDFVKGNALFGFEEEVQKGIKLHRQIDFYTDKDPLVKQAILLARPSMSKFSGVAVDIFFDYFLANNWEKVADENLRDFSDKIYNTIEKNREYLPDRAKLFFKYMVQHDILFEYQDLEKLDFVFQGMHIRSGKKGNLDKAIKTLVSDQDQYEKLFLDYFPKVQFEVSCFLQKLNQLNAVKAY